MKTISILAGNLNLGRSYLVTTVLEAGALKIRFLENIEWKFDYSIGCVNHVLNVPLG